MELLNTSDQILNSIPLPPATSRHAGDARAIQWEELQGATAITQASSPNAFRNEMLDLRIELGRTRIYRDELPKLRAGSVVPLDNAAGDLVDLYAGGRLIARGEVLAIEGVFGVRVVELVGGDSRRR